MDVRARRPCIEEGFFIRPAGVRPVCHYLPNLKVSYASC